MQKNTHSAINENMIKNRLYERFIKPTTNGYKDYIWVEVEIPILNLEKTAVNFNIVHKVTTEFLENFSQNKSLVIDQASRNSYKIISLSINDYHRLYLLAHIYKAYDI